MRIAVVLSILAIIAIGIGAPVLFIRFRKRWVAAFNQRVTNRITRHFAGRLPGFGILTHKGRRSGRIYHTPINVFKTRDGFLIALTYGREAEWVKNVLAARGAQLETQGRHYDLSAPEIVHDPSRKNFPPVVRSVLWIIGANDFMQLTSSGASPT
ncbi:MAG: nitroreductase family deazaflavin-dependent oxidoreductase [Candidatus Sulfotelmatobacter sp.]